MHSASFFYQALVYLSAAVISVPLAKRLGLGSVLGYLIAGAIIGPGVLGLIGTEGQDVMHFAEFGVVMMLFVIGLELEPARLWRMRAALAGLGGLQVVVTSVVLASLARMAGLPWRAAWAAGMTFALSSTAIVLQTLQEKGLMKTAAGQSAFAVLLFQDIAVIPMLAVFPLLAPANTHAATSAEHHWMSALPGWAQTVVVLGAVIVIVIVGRYLVRPALRFIAHARLLEIFTAAALLLVTAIALLMTQVGLSPALGTFLAGVVLANSEYRHELVSDLEPFKGLLLGLFLIAVGASLNFQLIAQSPLGFAVLVLGLMLVKGLVLYMLGRFFKLSTKPSLTFAFALSQVGEFAFVLISFAAQQNILEEGLAGMMVAVVALSMVLTPLALMFNEKVLLPRIGTKTDAPRVADAIAEHHPVIIAGFDHFAQITGRLLKAHGIGMTVLDFDSDRVERLRQLGLKVYYGDASRPELLHAAGAEQARLIIIAFAEPEKNLALVRAVQRHFPHLTMLVRALDRPDAYQLLNAGIDRVYRETVDAALRLGTDAMRLLGHRAYRAQRAAKLFLLHDERVLQELAQHFADNQSYLNLARQRIAELENLIKADAAESDLELDAGWDVESLRAEEQAGVFKEPDIK